MRDKLWEELLAKVKGDESRAFTLVDEIKLKASFKIKMDMVEAEDFIML